MLLEHKFAENGIQGVTQEDRNGVPVGIVRGYLATWQPDVQAGRYGKPDRFRPGAFKASILEHKRRLTHSGAGRGIPLRDDHGRTVGNFPIEHVKEDSVGLFGQGEINLELQQGRELYSMARQEVVTDFSIGFQAVQDLRHGPYRDIVVANVGEASLIDEPKNRGSKVTEVKSLSHVFHELPMAPGSHCVTADQARAHVLEMKFADGDGNHAFLCGNRDYPIGDYADGRLMAVPQLIRDAALELKSVEETPAIKALMTQVERYLTVLGEESPFETKSYFDLDEVKGWTPLDLETNLRATGLFSKTAAKLIAGMELKSAEIEPDTSLMDALEAGFAEWRSAR